MIGVPVDLLTATVSTRAGAGAVIESVTDGSRSWGTADLRSGGVTHAVDELSDAWTGCTTTLTLTR